MNNMIKRNTDTTIMIMVKLSKKRIENYIITLIQKRKNITNLSIQKRQIHSTSWQRCLRISMCQHCNKGERKYEVFGKS